MKEEWKKFYYKNEETHYSVSNLGKVRNDETGYILKPIVHKKTKYHMMPLTIHGKTKFFSLSRLVASLFIPNPNNYEEVDHVTCDRYRNEFYNLEWVTHEENMRRALKNNLIYTNDGSEYVFHSREEVENLCSIMENKNIPLDELSKLTNFNINSINKIRTGKRWKSVSSNYNLQNYNKYIDELSSMKRKGENNPNSKYSNELIRSVCKELENNVLSVSQICEKYDVSKDLIYDLTSGKAHKDIGSNYKLDNYDMTEFGYHRRDLEKVTELLKLNVPPRDIILMLQLPNTAKTLRMIYGRKRNI